MWTNPSQKSRQGSDRPPIPAMPVFWEFLFLEPLPNLKLFSGLNFLSDAYFATLKVLKDTF